MSAGNTTFDESILLKYKEMTKHSSSPHQSAFILKLVLKENKYIIEEAFDTVEGVEEIADEVGI